METPDTAPDAPHPADITEGEDASAPPDHVETPPVSADADEPEPDVADGRVASRPRVPLSFGGIRRPSSAAGFPAPRALIYLALCAAFAAALLASMLLGGAAARTTAACGGAVIAQAAVVPDPAGPPHLFAVVRPPAAPNVSLGNVPGCQTLYRSDDNGLTWTVVFSATAEAPAVVLPAGASRLYLLTQRLQFPLYLAGNLYRSDSLGVAWTWQRVSPQDRHAIPRVSAADALLGPDGSVLLHETNGDGAALTRSTDGGVTWQPLVIPGLLSTGSVATLGPLIAVAPALYTPGRPPGLVTGDGVVAWTPLARLPRGAPPRRDLRPLLAGDPVERALLLNLVPAGAVVPDHPVARYASTNGGHIWVPVRCGDRPAPGCAPPARWAQGAVARYVLYHRRIFRAQPGARWQPLPVALPVASDTVLQLLASPSPGGDTLYLVTATGIWRLEGRQWQPSSPGLPLGGPTPTVS